MFFRAMAGRGVSPMAGRKVPSRIFSRWCANRCWRARRRRIAPIRSKPSFARREQEAAELDSGTRLRIEAMLRGLQRRGIMEIGGWRHMLAAIEAEPAEEFVDWLALERSDGVAFDIGMHRHWVDPMRPFAIEVMTEAHGVLITS